MSKSCVDVDVHRPKLIGPCIAKVVSGSEIVVALPSSDVISETFVSAGDIVSSVARLSADV